MASETQKYQRRIRELERLLLPFAKEADQWADTVPDRYRPGVTEPRCHPQASARAEFSIGHLRKVRKALATPTPNNPRG